MWDEATAVSNGHTVTARSSIVHPADITSLKATAAKQAECASRALTLSCGTRMSRRRRTQLQRRPGQETSIVRVVNAQRSVLFLK